MTSGGAPDYVGLVAGVRTWRLANTVWASMGGWLWSLAMLDCWRKGQEWKEAECKLGHDIPDPDCVCGVWAYNTVEEMERYLGVNVVRAPLGNLAGGDLARYEYVTGVIGAAGDMVEHELGFRAQYAKVLALFDDGRDTPKREILESYPGTMEIIAPDDYDAFCLEHGLIRLDWQE
jgi:hypothetical protein